MRVYTVGGWVRDTLLARAGRAITPGDRDWVVVGATPEMMLAAGYRPVGKDFPVFLHPRTQEEYALARTERKTAPGYKGFVFHADPSVTLEEDLVRRDLTVNAMAMDEAGTLTDPHGGERDLAARVLRHVSPAFAEDPVRILRVARFAAQFPDFTVASETGELMRSMVAAGEVDALVPERVMQELSRGLMQPRPSRLLAVLSECGALARLAPELPEAALAATAAALDRAADAALPLPARLALLLAAVPAPESAQAMAERLRAPAEAIALTRLLAELRGALGAERSAEGRVRLFERADLFRRPERFEDLLRAWEVNEQTDAAPWRSAATAARSVDAGRVAALAASPASIPQAVHAARVAAVAAQG
jgi:tRNA nucleotidyltransferase (CCA-adding enzyme)